MNESHFRPEHKAELKRIFTELADFIHQHGLEQVVSAGPTAAPFSKAIQRAYANRHGGKLSIVNLGEAGETFRKLNTSEEVLEHLRKHKPNFDPSRRTLLFDELALSGVSLRATSRGLAQIGLPHKTAVLVNCGRASFDYVGSRDNEPFSNLAAKVDFGLTGRLRMRSTGTSRMPYRQFITTLRQELAEIAGSVPKVGAKVI